MPSFFKFVTRMINGQPVYQSEGPAQVRPAADSAAADATKPAVIITRSECHINGNFMRCSGDIHNQSSQEVFVDEIVIFGVRHELQRRLEPGERNELEIYDGPTIKGRFINKCHLLYRTQQGDYFKSHYDVDCEQQPDGTQQIKRIRYLPPIEDS